jgi:hypothetical protein
MSLVLNVEILGEFKKLTAATSGAGKDLNKLNGTAKKISSGINKALGAIGIGFSLAILVDQFKEATKAAVEDRKSQELLSKALQDNLDATDNQVAAIEKYIGKAQLATGITDDKLRPAFAKLALSSGSLEESMDLLSIATDVAAGTGKDLDTVAQAMAKALEGNTGSLEKLVPSIKGAKDPLAELAATFDGAAEAAAKTDPYAQLEIIFGEIQEQVGTALLPILEQFSEWLQTPEGQEKLQEIVDGVVDVITELTKVITWIGKNEGIVVGLGIAIGTVTTAIKILEITSRINAPKIAASMAGAFAWTAGVLTALRAISSLTAILTIPGSAPLPGTVPSTTKPGPIAPMPVFPGNAPQTGLPGANTKPTVVNNITINTPSTNATGIVSSLQGYQNQTGVTLGKLLK